MKIWIDDIRLPPTKNWIWIRSNKDFETINNILCFNSHNIEEISFDHDLGDDVYFDGYFIAKMIEEMSFHKIINIPFKWKVHSANPVGRKRIIAAMKNAEKYWSEK